MLTPTTHPQHYNQVKVGDYDYFTPKVIGLGLQESLTASYEDAYKLCRPDELNDGNVEDEKMSAWLKTREGKRMTDRAAAKFLFIPATPETPAMEGDQYEILPMNVFSDAFNLFSNPSRSSSSEQNPLTTNLAVQ